MGFGPVIYRKKQVGNGVEKLRINFDDRSGVI